jgi:hypothetical protein
MLFFSLAVEQEVAPVMRKQWARPKDRQYKRIYTGGSYKITASDKGSFSLAVCISEPPVKILSHWRLCYADS